MPRPSALRPILTVTGALALGFIIGMIAGGSSSTEVLPGTANAAASAAQETAEVRARRGVVQAWVGPTTPGGFESLIDPRGDVGAQFDNLVRGALRLSDNIDRMARMRDIARSVRLIDLPAAVEASKKLPMMDQWVVTQALGARWAEEAPAQAADFAVKEGSSLYGWSAMLYGVMEKWATLDRDAAVAWLGKQSSGRRAQIMQSLIPSIARNDPEAALRIVQSQPSDNQSDWLHGQVFEYWSKRDPAGAAKAAESIAPSAKRDQALQSVAASWAALDPTAATRWAQSFSEKHVQNQLLRSVAGAWAERDAKAVIQWAGTITEPAVRQDILGTAFARLAQTDAAAAKAQLSQIPAGQERDNLVTQVVHTSAYTDPKSALSLLELLPNGATRGMLATSLVMQTAASDPEAAVEVFATVPAAQKSENILGFTNALATGNLEFAQDWVEQLTDPQLKEQATRGIAAVMATGNPRGAAEWLMTKDPSADLSGVLQGWTSNAPKEVLAWTKDLPDGEAKRSAQALVIQRLSGVDLEQARQLFMEDLSPEAQVSAAGQLTRGWADRDVAAARTWAEALPPGGARENALTGLVGSWAKQDPAAAAKWLEHFSPGDERDRVVAQFAASSLQRDPASAMTWARSISDPDLRGAHLEQLGSRWMQINSAAASAWISSAEELTPSARRRIVELRTPAFNPNYSE